MGLTKSETAAMGDTLIAAGGKHDAAVAKAQNLVGALSAAAAQAARCYKLNGWRLWCITICCC